VTSTDLSTLIGRAERVLAQLEAWLPPAPPEIDWTAHAFRWRKRGARGWLDAVAHVSTINQGDRKSNRMSTSMAHVWGVSGMHTGDCWVDFSELVARDFSV